MAFLNANEREKLRDELLKLNFNQAKRKLHRIDPKARLAFIRNNQTTGIFHTRFELVGMGTQVTLIENYRMNEVRGGKFKSEFTLVDVMVEPTADNKL